MQPDTKQTALNILNFHHVGLLVEHIESATKQYAELFGEENISNSIYISSQKVKVCFVKISAESFIELVQPEDEQSVVYKLLKKRINYYHMAYRVKDIVSAVDTLQQLNYKPLEFFNSEAFENKRCIFLFTPDAYLIELIED
jgi:hypothetical protein